MNDLHFFIFSETVVFKITKNDLIFINLIAYGWLPNSPFLFGAILYIFKNKLSFVSLVLITV